MNFSKFVFYTSAGAAIWNIILCGLGVLLAKTVDEKDLFNRIEYYNDYLSYFGYGIGVVCVLYIVWQLLKPKKNTQK